ncbi:DHS-like NAD/FAD-binding domain-containing protein [Ceratobasidium sp. AG-I]|nr:DHS-like NAD/FAD-binding domain-containing protein [Ceratobasidium sp. AG-I]
MPSFTNSARVDSRVKFYDTLDQERGRNTAYRVLQGVAQSKNLLVFCGSGISVDAGLPTFQDQARSSEVVPSTPISWNNFLSEFTVPKPSPAQINVINKATTAYRIMARQATPTNFHRFVQRKMDLGECSRCITRNFDGLETRDRSDLSSRVTMLHGDNNTLRCSVLRCSSVQGEQVASFDARFLEGETVSCPSCEESAKKNTRSRIRPGPLQANLLLDGRIDPNVEREQLLAEARNADTLLIAGTNIDTIDIYSFVEELVQTVRRKAGVIVFINSANIITTKLAHLIDFYLQLDVQACAETLFYIMKEDNNECGQAVWDEVRIGVFEHAKPSYPSLTVEVVRRADFRERNCASRRPMHGRDVYTVQLEVAEDAY